MRIKSENFTVEINPIGAELSSFRSNNAEYIWQGDPKWWAGRAPILFPVLCSLKGGKYSYSGKEYNMTKHGFVRDAEFTVAEAYDKKAVLEYRDNEATYKMYPFKFLLQVIFELIDNTLHTTYRVKNHNCNTMYFSIGAHEAYRCPRNDSEKFEDYYIEFDKADNYHSETLSPDMLINGETYPVIKNGHILPLEYKWFEKDTLIFKNIQCRSVLLKSKKSPAVVDIAFGGAPYLGIWTKIGAPYVCIEPWYGMPDEENHNGKIENKLGIVALDADKEFSWTHSITIHENINI
ncbi:MAG: aldose 1-epimerase family protein [Defluviitaleaceae bacterium]|nr:aldose 1-epimerase family protein [Defluviitaleaceae bacterium]